MSTAAISELSASREPVRGRAEWVIRFNRRHGGSIGLLLWGAAAAVFSLHFSGLGLPNPTRFAMLDCWLVGLGCLGCPILALRSLGSWLTPQTCMIIAAFCAALALLMTALTLGGALHFHTLNALFAVILPLAVAIQAVAAADAETHARKREARGYRRGRLEVFAAQFAKGHAALAGLDRLEGMTVDELEGLTEAITTLIKAKQGEAHILHLPSPAERRRARQRIDPA